MSSLPRLLVSLARSLACMTLLLSLATARAEQAHSTFEAIRTSVPPQLDGQLDDEVWATAPSYTRFVQTFPQEGAEPTERTEVRVLYDDQTLYVGIINFDSQPQLVNRQLGRRGQPPESDIVTVSIDSAHDRRTAYAFSVNAGGTLRDTLYFDDNKSSNDWDAIWDGRAALRPDGWSVELAIPLRLLRFPSAPIQDWGFAVRREIARKSEVIDSILIPRNANAFVSRFGNLVGMQGLEPHMDVELTPYVASRASRRPLSSDPFLPRPRLWEPSADVGLDVKLSLTSQLVLNATINPDFGQVEADELILNLSTFEAFFPEKRPFFTQGMDIFQPAGAEISDSSQMLFYSRRIGLDTPILAATKLTGAITRNIQIGLLDAVVMDASPPSRADEDPGQPDSRYQFHPTRPFHFAPNSALPREPGVPQNFFMAISRATVAPGSTVGLSAGAATPLGHRCGSVLPEEPGPRDDCLVAGGNAAALDWNLRTQDGNWVFVGQLAGSQVVGGPQAGQLRRDGTLLRPGDTGLGTYMTAGLLGGDPLRFSVGYEYASPRLELNATGFQTTQNQQSAKATVEFVRPSGWGPLHTFSTSLNAYRDWTTDSRALHVNDQLLLLTEATLPGFHVAGFKIGAKFNRQDIREIPLTGIPIERPDYQYITAWGETNRNLPLSLRLDAYVNRLVAPAPTLSKHGQGATLTTIWRPLPNLETQFIADFYGFMEGPRWLETLPNGRYLFSEQEPLILSLTLRQLLVLSPQLTLQLYAQLFSATNRFGPFYEATPGADGRVHLADFLPTEPGMDPSYHEAALNMNMVLRWEYSPGATLFLVYSRAQQELPPQEGSAELFHLVLPNRLFAGASTDTLFVKWSHAWGL
ncbi:hypothetical protein BO221_23505 [Archangium sp. Cb G35]|uniref:DUF5916 domain-containing protein n=1 Tax=Archangium sp. Cb G35 TaxID=1920190 RepID=UPI0009369DF6|nr:DUF5916 domain-containing protein [Archangium sp. Cb G35]OJT22718.1 hypothetical protein BO221_23505 [Archangium sp. Cb G35]